ncbi:hypothetical protein [Parasitella parasitica]|uniref:Endonuclease/exonuclease/phosphatase domain-containing protein n=1 Tax=Parasitella parasitica TaxID=35722 RepID=A0A0B7NE66_9FUNG|nr:hypothetical protein [Parasitella parasitica]
MASSRKNLKGTRNTNTPGNNANSSRLWSHVVGNQSSIFSCHSSIEENSGHIDPVTVDDNNSDMEDDSERPTPQGSAASKYATRTDEFFSKILHQLTTLYVPVFILGDFNYDTTNDAIQRLYPNWLPFIRTHFIDCFEDANQPTFFSNIGSRSTIDYIYFSASAHTFAKSVKQTYMPYDWTDHELLSILYQLDFDNESSTRRGRGAWKANPFLGNEEIKTFTRSFQLDRNSWRQRSIKKLQSKYNRILRDYKNTGILSLLLPSLETLLGKLQEEQAAIDVLKAGKYWKGNNEKSAGVFRRLADVRASQREIPPLHNEETGALTSSHDEQVEVIHRFYSQLYAPSAPDPYATTILLSSDTARDVHRRLSPEQQNALMAPIEIEEIIELSVRASLTSSPGGDGLPYGILRLFLKHPAVASLTTTVYNAALKNASFPATWSLSLMTLIPKKGDPSQLTNLRPIQLVCTENHQSLPIGVYAWQVYRSEWLNGANDSGKCFLLL